MALAVTLVGCDQISQSNRYEISKDQTGRTLRIDKRTGDIAVIEGEKITPLRDAKEIDTNRVSEDVALARMKEFPNVKVQHMVLEATLRTSWQDGKVLYSVDLLPLDLASNSAIDLSALNDPASQNSKEPRDETKGQEAKAGPSTKSDKAKKAAKLTQFKGHVLRHAFSVHLEDVPFELMRDDLRFSSVVDDSGETIAYNAKGSLPMSKEAYKRIDTWNLKWRQRF